MDITQQVEKSCDDPDALEALYRQARGRQQERAFARAVTQRSAAAPENVLLRAWVCRLEPDAATPVAATPVAATPVAATPDAASPDTGSADAGVAARRRHWTMAVAFSIGCGVMFALFAGDKPPVPIPGEANPLFWIGWGPLAAVAIIAFIALVAAQPDRTRWQAGAAVAAIAAGSVSALIAGGRTDDVANLAALHLPFVAWAVIGASVTLGRTDRARHFYAYAVQSMEALVAAGIFLGAGFIFVGLTAGIFAVLGVEFPEWVLRSAAAFGIGIIPVLAVASVYDPALTPAEQRPTGLAYILRVMTWLMLPAALIVLGLYVFWFVPAYFWRPFDERAVLIVYNATIIAILVLLAAAVSVAAGRRDQGIERLLRLAVLSMSALTLLLNVYALAAVASRTFEHGLTPNRHAVLGWNLVTLLMLGFLLARTWSAERGDWLPTFRRSLGQALVPAIAWAAWVLWILPLV